MKKNINEWIDLNQGFGRKSKHVQVCLPEDIYKQVKKVLIDSGSTWQSFFLDVCQKKISTKK